MLASEYCQQEINAAIIGEIVSPLASSRSHLLARLLLCVIDEKHIQLVIEEEARFNPFDLEAWIANKDAAVRCIPDRSGEMVQVPQSVSSTFAQGYERTGSCSS